MAPSPPTSHATPAPAASQPARRREAAARASGARGGGATTKIGGTRRKNHDAHFWLSPITLALMSLASLFLPANNIHNYQTTSNTQKPQHKQRTTKTMDAAGAGRCGMGTRCQCLDAAPNVVCAGGCGARLHAACALASRCEACWNANEGISDPKQPKRPRTGNHNRSFGHAAKPIDRHFFRRDGGQRIHLLVALDRAITDFNTERRGSIPAAWQRTGQGDLSQCTAS